MESFPPQFIDLQADLPCSEFEWNMMRSPHMEKEPPTKTNVSTNPALGSYFHHLNGLAKLMSPIAVLHVNEGRSSKFFEYVFLFKLVN